MTLSPPLFVYVLERPLLILPSLTLSNGDPEPFRVGNGGGLLSVPRLLGLFPPYAVSTLDLPSIGDRRGDSVTVRRGFLDGPPFVILLFPVRTPWASDGSGWRGLSGETGGMS